MTEEIKKLLDLLEYCVEKNEYLEVSNMKEWKPLLNYITNLHKENQSLKEKLNCKEYFSSTMPENTEFIILTKENYDKQQKDLALENIILKSRNEKAVEYIENHSRFEPPYYEMREFNNKANLNELYNILQGGDE